MARPGYIPLSLPEHEVGDIIKRIKDDYAARNPGMKPLSSSMAVIFALKDYSNNGMTNDIKKGSKDDPFKYYKNPTP